MHRKKKLKQLKCIRKNKNYTYQYVADKLKISKTFYWHIESGTRRLSYHMAFDIAKIFNMKPDDLFYKDFKN